MALPASVDPIVPEGRTADIEAADRIFDKLEKGKSVSEKLTHAGREWLEVALDPFHDRALQVAGQPSYDQQNSICQVVKRTKTFGSMDGNAFDLHIASLPMDTGTPLPTGNAPNPILADTQRYGNNIAVTFPGNKQYGGTLGTITVAYVKRPPAMEAGTVLNAWPNDAGPPPEVYYTAVTPTESYYDANGKIVPENKFGDGLHRCVAAAFEVIVTTPPLYAGGLLTCYNQARRSQTFYYNRLSSETGQPIGPFSDCVLERAPPANANEAMLLPGTRQWEARLGAYVVLTQNGWDNEFAQPTSRLRVFDGKDALACSDAAPGTPTGICCTAVQTAPLVAVPPNMNMTDTPFSTKGVIMERLPAESIVTVNLRWIVERVPTLSEIDLVVLARPSPAYDELAWRFYSEAVRQMPPGVPLNENFTGDWFRGVARTIGKTLHSVAPVARAAAPLLGPKGMAVERALSVLERERTRPRKKRGPAQARKKGRPTPRQRPKRTTAKKPRRTR